MQLSGRPLLDNAADHALFVGRDDALARIDRALRSGLNCLVVGDPGSGKTSLVRAMMYRTTESAQPLRVTYVRANEARSAADLLTAILTALGPGRPTRSSAIDLLDDLTAELADADAGETGIRVMVVDDIGAAAGAELFGALRDELWQVGAQWLVTTSTAQSSSLLRPPADVFFETRIELGPLTEEEAAELLRRRIDAPGSTGSGREMEGANSGDTDDTDDERNAWMLAAVGSARETPRRLLEVVRELSADPAVGGLGFTTVTGLRSRSAALEQLSRPARMLAQELEALGWASASDERLLVRMGWTRPRVVQVIAELEGEGLVEMREESTGRGRPRKLYRLTPAAQYTPPDSAGGAPCPVKLWRSCTTAARSTRPPDIRSCWPPTSRSTP